MRLTDRHIDLLAKAAGRRDGLLVLSEIPLGAPRRAIQELIQYGLLIESKATSGLGVWRVDARERRFVLKLTRNGRAAAAFAMDVRSAGQAHAPRPPIDASRSRKVVSKRALILELLSKGATMSALRAATGWKPPSLRAFMAVVVRRRLNLPITSELKDGQRIYRITKTTPQRS